eukprot:2976861-Amphidinium_carterae.1
MDKGKDNASFTINDKRRDAILDGTKDVLKQYGFAVGFPLVCFKLVWERLLPWCCRFDARWLVHAHARPHAASAADDYCTESRCASESVCGEASGTSTPPFDLKVVPVMLQLAHPQRDRDLRRR